MSNEPCGRRGPVSRGRLLFIRPFALNSARRGDSSAGTSPLSGARRHFYKLRLSGDFSRCVTLSLIAVESLAHLHVCFGQKRYKNTHPAIAAADEVFLNGGRYSLS